MQGMTIREWLKQAIDELSGSPSQTAGLDAEIILAHTINHPRTWLHAHENDEIDNRHVEVANARLDLRLDNIPIAYIIGHKEFYGRRFAVSPQVLVPRPESEQLIELLNKQFSQTSLFPKRTARLVDIGTGSGCLGITAKLEHPELDVTLCDTSKSALAIAKKNATLLNADVTILSSNLLAEYPFTPDIVIANLPYVDPSWQTNEETKHEPPEALYADDNGLALIKKCILELAPRQSPGGISIFEADPRQHHSIIQFASKNGFALRSQTEYALCFTKP
jgi:release factor glutamine methyltransferase